MKTYEIQVWRNDRWERFLYWWGMKKGYATGAFNMLKGFSTGDHYRLVSFDGKVIDEARAPEVPKPQSHEDEKSATR